MGSLSVEGARCHNEAGKDIVAEHSCAYVHVWHSSEPIHSSTTTFHTQRTNLPISIIFKESKQEFRISTQNGEISRFLDLQSRAPGWGRWWILKLNR
jgi:hypothetical protein